MSPYSKYIISVQMKFVNDYIPLLLLKHDMFVLANHCTVHRAMETSVCGKV